MKKMCIPLLLAPLKASSPHQFEKHFVLHSLKKV